ncbi:MAG: DUF21 domain-containing protein [Proteobacteria bacterium]|nr:DUF21 domain-containing protein [Pseudomonadota bacterium]NOG60945.1 DUF21 domain-containing protein [Pseudomonadota bacterium]
MFVNTLVWTGIIFCISQSAMFSGLNLALLGMSRLRLEVEASAGDAAALKILALRKDFNFLLTTILWGNVAVNVLLTLLSQSVMAGIVAFFFSTFLITFAGEIMPQAYFSKHAMRMGSLLAPLIRIYQFILFPVAKPSAIVLDFWLGEEGIRYFRESDLQAVISKHIESGESDVNHMEGTGAINFLRLDDIMVEREGEIIDPDSVISLPTKDDMPIFPEFERQTDDPFLRSINRSGKKWVIIVNENNHPCMVLNANNLLRECLFKEGKINPYNYCHRPVKITDKNTLIGDVLSKLKVYPESEVDNVVDNDLILVWSEEKRIITGANILGRLLQGIVLRSANP